MLKRSYRETQGLKGGLAERSRPRGWLETRLDVVRKVAKFIERLAEERDAVVVVGRITHRAKRRWKRIKTESLDTAYTSGT
jgi:hypothetical protein